MYDNTFFQILKDCKTFVCNNECINLKINMANNPSEIVLILCSFGDLTNCFY